MNSEQLNYKLDELKSIIDGIRDKNADDIRKSDILKISDRYERLYGDLKAQLSFIGQVWTVNLRNKDGFIVSVPGKFLSEGQAENAAVKAINESPEAVNAILYCDGVLIRAL